MKLISGVSGFHIEERTAVAIGKFDGLHRGHLAILKEILKQKKQGFKSAVFTFDPSPASFFSGREEESLMSKEEKRKAFEALGVDYLVEFPFNRETAATSPEDFIRKYLKESLNAAFVAAGTDLSFGAGGKGDAAFLMERAKEYGYTVAIIPKVDFKGREISSTYVREALGEGNRRLASYLLGRSVKNLCKPVLALLLVVAALFIPCKARASEKPIDAQLPKAGITEFLEESATKEEYVEAYNESQGKYFGFTHLGVAGTADNNLNIREAASLEGKLVGKLPKNAGCEVLSREGEWYRIKSGKVEGYVFSEYLLTGPAAVRRAQNTAATLATSTTGGLRVREEPNLDADIVTLVAEGEQLEVVEELDGWVKVNLDDDLLYVSADYVNVAISLEKAVSMKELTYGAGISNTRIDLVNYAKKFLGNPYVWGGASLTKGADCSGYVMSIFKQFGVSLPHSSKAQANCGTKIKASQLKPGDLVFYGKRSVINHVAIYIGNGQVINASNKRSGICIKGVNYRTPLKYVRILKD